MTVDISTLSTEELQAGLVAELNGTVDADSEGTNEEVEETTETEDVTEETAEESEQEAPEVEKPKKGVAKILAERNEARKREQEALARIKELEANAGESKETDIAYIKETAKNIASDMIKDEKFYSENALANEYREAIEVYKEEHNLSTESAYKLFLAETMPEEFATMIRKGDAKKTTPPALSSSKLRVTKDPKELSTNDLKSALQELYKKGEVEF